MWSRAYSYGSGQGLKLMYIIGEQGFLGEGIDRPELQGIYLGTTPLDTLSPNKYAFYWNRNTKINGRIKAKNLAYGTRATPDAGDPQANDDIFLCPSAIATNDAAFSQSYTPSSNNVFGCFGGIANGTGYRLNFELVPLPLYQGEDDPPEPEKDRLSASLRKRQKISGDYKPGELIDIDIAIQNGQRSVGREYSRRMGLRFLNGVSTLQVVPTVIALAEVKVGDTAVFVIEGGFIPEDKYWQTKTRMTSTPTTSTTPPSDCARRLTTSSKGQIIMIGMTVWVVKSRAVDVFGEGIVGPFAQRPNQNITLECVDMWAVDPARRQIGFVSNDAVIRGIRTDDQGAGTYEYKNEYRRGLTIGPGFFPLMQVNFASIRNTRACESTEFGIKSQVWNQANNLCNFSSLPTPEGLQKSDTRGDSLTSGVMNTYFTRSSVFTVFLRPAGTDENGEDRPWAAINEQFVIQGKRPVDQFNFLRFIHPEIREYEFKFVPKNGADLTQYAPDDAELILLDARLVNYAGQGANFQRQYGTPYGTFLVQAAGRPVLKRDIEFAPEMSTGVQSNEDVIPPTVSVPKDILIAGYTPDIEGDDSKATAVAQVGDGWSQFLKPRNTDRQHSSLRSLAKLPPSTPQGRPASASTVFAPQNLAARALAARIHRHSQQILPPNHPEFRLARLVINGHQGLGVQRWMNTADSFNCRVPTDPSNPRNPEQVFPDGTRGFFPRSVSKSQSHRPPPLKF